MTQLWTTKLFLIVHILIYLQFKDDFRKGEIPDIYFDI